MGISVVLRGCGSIPNILTDSGITGVCVPARSSSVNWML